ncbi:MAG: aldo/keto reductase [Armatimonadota bacterium]
MYSVNLSPPTLQVSALCLGTAEFGAYITGENAQRLVEEYLSLGGNFIDTAHCYAFWTPAGAGCSERELGRLIRALGVREQVVIATKGGHSAGGNAYPRPDGYMAPELVARDLAESLDRLQMERVDLYYLHRDDPRVPVDEVIDSLNEHIRAGRVRAIGASNWSTARIEQANHYAVQHGLQGFIISQVQWSLAIPNWKPSADPTTRYVTEEDAEWYAQHKIPVAAYTATASGYFSGTQKGEEGFGNPTNAERRERVRQLAQQMGVTPTQIALAWLLHQKPTVIPIFSTGNVEHLKECMSAVKVSLTPQQVDWLAYGGGRGEGTA